MRFRKGGPVKAWEYWRVAVDGHHPTRTLMATPRASDRMRAQMQRAELSLEPWRKAGEHIVIAGSSAKYHAFYGLPEPTEYAEELVRQLQRITGRPIVYRPKPSWRGAVPIGGARYSPRDEGIEDVLSGAHVLVTHGSNACFEAVISGVPCIVLGDAVAKPISSQNLREIEMPYLATDEERDQWLANLGWCQWTLREFADGDAWAAIRPQIYG